MDATSRRRQSLMAQMATIQQQLDQLVDIGDLDTYPDGAIIKASISHSGPYNTPYTCVFLRTTDGNVDRWYFTGNVSRGDRWVDTATLLAWLTMPGRTIVSWDLMQLPGSAKRRIVAENVVGETVVDEEAPSAWT